MAEPAKTIQLDVLTREGKKVGREVTLSDEIFGVEPNEHAVYLVVKQHLANRRRGTHATMLRRDHSGSTRKLRRQKGSGMARVGSVKAPQLRGGVVVFGPRPRDYSFRLNRKLKGIARVSVLSGVVSDSRLSVVEDFELQAPRTRTMQEMKKLFSSEKESLLYVSGAVTRNVMLSTRNVEGFSMVRVEDVNTYDILQARRVVLSEKALQYIHQTFVKS